MNIKKSLNFVFAGVCAISVSLAAPFNDEQWRAKVLERGEKSSLKHYDNSLLPLPDVTQFGQGNFKWGVAIAEFQNSGAEIVKDSNWALHEAKNCQKNKGLERSGKACNHWEDYPQDVELMEALGLNSLRFSIDWSMIEPVQGRWNEEALVRYEKLCDALIAKGMSPMVTLHHFVHPRWFDELGGFEKEENIEYFVAFAEKVFERFHDKISLWCTINEPAVYAMCGYLLGIHAPGKPGQIGMAGTVLKNLLKAHVAIYKKLHSMIDDNGWHNEQHEVGLVHNYLKFQSRYQLDPIGRITASLFTGISNDPVMRALRTNKFYFDPLRTAQMSASVVSLGALGVAYARRTDKKESMVDWVKKHWIAAGATATVVAASTLYRFMTKDSDRIDGLSESFDFMGLNYYARAIIGFNRDNTFGPTCFPDQVMGEMDLPISDPQGFSVAIKALSALGKPIYITETGCADATDQYRPFLLRESLYVIGEALKAGIDIRGYYHWTLMDNYEWHNAYKPKFGLCDMSRKPRLSAYWLQDFICQAK